MRVVIIARNCINSELVLGIIATVGTDIDEVIKCIKDQLGCFNYAWIETPKMVLKTRILEVAPFADYSWICEECFMNKGRIN